jgi:poly(3-hydroxybutyrate) depolymerase
MTVKAPSLFTTACLLAFCGFASAYTITGSVSDDQGAAIKDASVSLLKEGKAATTDDQGKFTIHEDEAAPSDSPSLAILSAFKYSVGYISVNNGVLSYAQSGTSPVQIKIFNSLGHQVFKKTLHGAGSYDLSQDIKARGTYFAHISVGNARQNFRFTTNGNYSSTFGSQAGTAALMKAAAQGEAIRFAADGFDTLTVPLGTLDTTLDVKLKKSAPTFKFGYALKNEPTPSKGCGSASKLQKVNSVENGDHFQIKVGSDTRDYFITLPKNYDNSKPHKVLFALHCYGSRGEDFVHHAADYDHPTPYYGQQVLDKNGDYIFVSLDAIGGLWNKGQPDHDFFAQTLTALNENYCIDTSRVFITGFSYGAMFSYSLMQDMQHRVRAAATYAVADYNIWLPEGDGMKELPIAWMNVHGKNDDRCDYNRAKTSALPRILKRNGKADADGNFTDASSEKPEEVQGNTGHVCYDFTTVDERFPVRWCSWPGNHQWTAHDTGNMSIGWNWEQTWVPEEVHKFFEQF